MYRTRRSNVYAPGIVKVSVECDGSSQSMERECQEQDDVRRDGKVQQVKECSKLNYLTSFPSRTNTSAISRLEEVQGSNSNVRAYHVPNRYELYSHEPMHNCAQGL